MKMRSWRKGFKRDNSGATAVEFAIAFPLILFTSMGALELSLFYFGNQTITNTMNQAIRKGMIGCERSEFDVQGDCINDENVLRMVDPNSIRRHIARKTKGFVDACSDRFVLTAYPLGSARNIGQVNLGQGSDIVMYEATYDWPVFTPLMWSLEWFGDGSLTRFTYRSVVRNEKFFRTTAMAGRRNSGSGVDGSDCDWKGKNS